MKQTILSIAGKSGLYKLISQGKNNLIVETLDATHKRQPAFGSDRITSLSDIAMFTDTDDVPLMDVLESLKTLEQGKKSALDLKKASGDDLREYFAKVLPTFDRERVHTSDIKKLLQWYNILVENGITNFKEEEEEAKTTDIPNEENPEQKTELKTNKPKAEPKAKEPKLKEPKAPKADSKSKAKETKARPKAK